MTRSNMTSPVGDWLDLNRFRSYPFLEDSDFSLDGGFEVPMDILVDMAVVDTRWVTETGELPHDRKPVVLSGLLVDGGVATLMFSYDGMTFGIPVEKGEGYASGRMSVGEESDRDMPVLVRFVVNRGWSSGIPDGEYRATGRPEILPTLVMMLPAGLGMQRISTASGSVDGEVHLRPGCNCRMKIHNGMVNVEVARGEGAGKCCGQGASGLNDSCREAMLYFNGQVADTNGNITLYGGGGTVVEPGGMYKGRIPSVVVKPSSALDVFTNPSGRHGD